MLLATAVNEGSQWNWLNITHCWLRTTVHFQTLNKFNASLELDFLFILPTDKLSFVFFAQIANIFRATWNQLKSCRLSWTGNFSDSTRR